MHPDTRFRIDDRGAMLDAAARIGLAHIVVATPTGLMTVHAPVTRSGDRLHFHVARRNRAADHLDGATLALSFVGEQGYVSPNWYAPPSDQVPTWNYRAIEIDGTAAVIEDQTLVAHLDALAALHEPIANPGTPWTRDKMSEPAFARMLRGIRGFELAVTAVRGTAKLSQNKSDADRAGVIAGLVAAGNGALAAAMT